jgi:hypothetical protein
MTSPTTIDVSMNVRSVTAGAINGHRIRAALRKRHPIGTAGGVILKS